mgnify:CR=1 FL=1
MFSLREICSHLANRALLTLSLDCDIYAFVIVWFVIHIVSVSDWGRCSDCQWVACGACAPSAFLGSKIIKVEMANNTVTQSRYQ